MAKYLSPGIYEEELLIKSNINRNKSAAVFLGYTQRVETEDGRNIQNIPVTIRSVKDFERNFGFPQKEDFTIIDESTLDEEKITLSFTENSSLHILYYAVKAFFDQGVDSCIIISVGTFKNKDESLSANDFLPGLKSLKNLKENLLISVPESQNMDIEEMYILQKKLLEFCSLTLNFAILDTVKTTNENFVGEINAYREKFNPICSPFGGVFFPDLISNQNYIFDESNVQIQTISETLLLKDIEEKDPKLYTKYLLILEEKRVVLPPSSVVIGALIKNDEILGLWKFPSKTSINNVSSVEIQINDQQQEWINSASESFKINCIRKFYGKGILIWGGRTMRSNDPEFKYITYRRLLNSIQKDIQHFLKELTPLENNTQTWNLLKQAVSNYLNLLWKTGALTGLKDREAFFVRAGLHETMTELDLLEGRLIIECGLAVSRPSEFVIIKIRHHV